MTMITGANIGGIHTGLSQRLPPKMGVHKTTVPQSYEESYVSGTEAPHKYTIISLLPANLGGGLGADSESAEYFEKLAPQIKDDKLAVVMLGTFPDKNGRAWKAQRFEIDASGIHDTTDSLDGYHIAREYKDGKAGTVAEVAKGSQVSPLHPETLKRFVLDAMKSHPAERYVFAVNAHGSNSKGLSGCTIESYDPNVNEVNQRHQSAFDNLSLPELQRVLQEVRQESGNRFSVIDIDTCLMGHAEVIGALRDEADFIVASAAIECGVTQDGVDQRIVRNGHQQVEVFEKILSRQDFTPEQMAMDFVATNAKEGAVTQAGQGFDVAPTLAAFSTKRLGALDQALEDLGSRLQKELASPKSRGFFHSLFHKPKDSKKSLQTAIDQSWTYRSNKGEPYLDLKDFANRLVANFPDDDEMKQLASAVITGIETSMVASFKGKEQDENGKPGVDYKDFGALGVYLPGATDNPVSQAMRSDGARTFARLTSGSSDSLAFWEHGAANADRLGITAQERIHLTKAQQLTQQLQNANSPDRRELYKQLREINFADCGAAKIWKDRFSKSTPGWAEYKATPNVPQGWKDFVEQWTDLMFLS